MLMNTFSLPFCTSITDGETRLADEIRINPKVNVNMMTLLSPSSISKLRIERKATYALVSNCSGGKENL